MTEKYLIQIMEAQVVSKAIKADSMYDALKQANEIAAKGDLLRPRSKAWTIEWHHESQVVGVIK